MFPKDQLEELDSEIAQMISETSDDNPRLGELKNIKTSTEYHVEVLKGQISVDDIKQAAKLLEEARDKIAALKADPNSAGVHDEVIEIEKKKGTFEG